MIKSIMYLDKRKKYVITSIVLSFGFAAFQLINAEMRFLAIGVLGILTLLLFAWSLLEGLGKNATLLTLVLPAMFSIGVGLFWFLLPQSVLTRLPIVIIYAVTVYALCLTTNIYTVAAIRTIALLRAARGVGFALTLLTSFLLFDTVLSIKAPILVSSLLVGAISFPLLLQGFWTIPLSAHITKELFVMSGIFALIMGEMAMLLYFWPTKVVVGSLFLTIGMYVLLGLGQARLEGRLFKTTVREYLVIGLAVFIGMFLATSWSGG